MNLQPNAHQNLPNTARAINCRSAPPNNLQSGILQNRPSGYLQLQIG